MLPIDFEGATWIGKPQNMTDEECSGISAKIGIEPNPKDRLEWFFKALEVIDPDQITDENKDLFKLFYAAALQQIKPVNFYGVSIDEGIDQSGFPYFCTAWKPSKEDLDALNRGEPIYVKVISSGLPPMWIFTVNEKGEANV